MGRGGRRGGTTRFSWAGCRQTRRRRTWPGRSRRPARSRRCGSCGIQLTPASTGDLPSCGSPPPGRHGGQLTTSARL
uniref:Uncharacterized protein n=1 Tax=Arundo donax TaxID=35708 RepID=A0A0A9FC14_ARUDO